MEEDDVMAWNFYGVNATAFTRDFGLMPSLMAEVGYAGPERSLFLSKLSAIHDMVVRKGNEKVKKAGPQEKPGLTLEGGENG